MAISVQMTKAGTGLGDGELALIGRLSGAHGRVTLLVPTYAEGEACRRRLADAGVGVSVDVLTPSAWIEGLWRLLGDGTRLVAPRERLLLASRVLGERAGGDGSGIAPLKDNPGSVHMVADMARRCLPFAVGAPLPEGERLSPAERRAIEVLGAYEELLFSLGLREPSRAAMDVARMCDGGAPACLAALVVRPLAEYPEHLLRLVEAVGAQGDAVLVAGVRQPGLARALADRFGCAPEKPEGAEPPMAVPAFAEVCGPSARLSSYALMASELISRLGEGEEALIAGPDPLALFRGLAPRLAPFGAQVACEASVPFPQTRAGEMLFTLIDFLDRLDTQEASSWWPAPELADWLRSPFSGVGPSSAHIALSLDAMLRKTRSLDRGRLLAELDSRQSREQNRERARAERYGSPARPVVFKQVIDAILERRLGRAVQLMHAAAAAAPADAFGVEGLAAQRAELTALQAALELLERGWGLGVTGDRTLVALRSLRVPVMLRALPAGEGSPADGPKAAGAAAGAGDVPAAGASVRIVTLDALAAMGAASCPSVLLVDMSAEAYPLSERETASSVLAGKLDCAGLFQAPAERQRTAVVRALQAARTGSMLAFACRDDASEEIYPALAYAELRAEFAGRAPAIAAPDLPGEGALVGNLDPLSARGLSVDDAPRLAEHLLDPSLRRHVLLSHRCINGRPVTRTLSASQVENYLACPYRWFVNSRVVTRRLDVEFGPIERGNFSHDVMQRFYERLRECGLVRVTPATLDRCLGEMDLAFEEVRQDHLRGKYTHGKYASEERPRAIRGALVPLDELERMRIDAMLEQFHEVVRHDAEMLPIYAPSMLEYSFDREGVVYAGRPLGGRIDRVDVAPDAGSGERFVVIDYKTGANVSDMVCPDPTMNLEEGERVGEGWLPGRDRDRAPKVQTLMYATALERSMGGSAQGAVYYGLRGPSVVGAVSSALSECEPPAFLADKVSPFPGVKGRMRVKRDGDMEFPELLERVEAAISSELDRLEGGDIAPRPASDSCSFCPLTTCEKRR